MRMSRRELGLSLAAASLATVVTPAIATADAASLADDLMRVDPELRAGAERIASQPPIEWNMDSLARVRAIPPMALPPGDARASVEQRVAPGMPGQPDVKFELIAPRGATGLKPAVVHIHGGGYILGRVTDTTAMCQAMAVEFGCVVANVDYRLAPETPFPGPMEDCYAVLAWIHANAESLGVDPRRVAVMGESAGGGLAAMVAIAARDRRMPLCYQVLIYPMLDDRTGSTVRVPPFIGSIGWNEAGNRFGWTSMLGQPAGAAEIPYGAVPARLADVSELAPAFIGVGGLDLFVDEDIEYARRLVAAGVSTQLHLTPGAFHGFDFVSPEARVSREFTAAWKSALRARFETI